MLRTLLIDYYNHYKSLRLLPGIRKIPALPPLLHRRQNRAHFSKNGGDILSTYLYDTSTTCCLSGDTVTISGDISLLYLHQQQLKSSSFCQSRTVLARSMMNTQDCVMPKRNLLFYCLKEFGHAYVI